MGGDRGGRRRVVRFTADGSLDRKLDVPAPFVSSLCFGGEDMRDVFITTGDGKLLRGRSDVAGLATHAGARVAAGTSAALATRSGSSSTWRHVTRSTCHPASSRSRSRCRSCWKASAWAWKPRLSASTISLCCWPVEVDLVGENEAVDHGQREARPSHQLQEDSLQLAAGEGRLVGGLGEQTPQRSGAGSPARTLERGIHRRQVEQAQNQGLLERPAQPALGLASRQIDERAREGGAGNALAGGGFVGWKAAGAVHDDAGACACAEPGSRDLDAARPGREQAEERGGVAVAQHRARTAGQHRGHVARIGQQPRMARRRTPAACTGCKRFLASLCRIAPRLAPAAISCAAGDDAVLARGKPRRSPRPAPRPRRCGASERLHSDRFPSHRRRVAEAGVTEQRVACARKRRETPPNKLSAWPDEGLDALEERTRYDPQEVEPRVLARWLEAGYFHPEPEGTAAENYSIAIPPPERHGRAAHGPRAERRGAGRADPLQPHERPPHEVDLRHRPRRHRDAGAGREAARRGGHQPDGAGPRGVRAPRVGVARAVRAHDRGAVPAPGRLVRLRGRALHARRGLRRGGPEGVRRPLREGADLPRQLHGQLGPGHAVGDLGPRGRGPRGHRHALLHRLPARGRRRR